MNVYKLEAAIGLNSTEYQKGLKAAGESMSAMGDKIKSGAATMAKVSAAAFTAITGAATATTAAILKGVDAYTSYGDSVDKMSQKLNMSATAYQEWSAIMEHSGTSIDSMQASMKTLANAVETGNDAFERLGISQEEIASMNNEQLFSRTISALQNVGNETERTYLAGQLLGRGATELGALLNTSAEDTEKMRQRVHELGGVMSDEAVKASAKYKDSIQDMKTAFVGMGRGLITDFVPALTEVSDGLAAIFSGEENGTDRFLKGFDSAMTALSTSASRIKPIVKKIGSIAVQVVPEIIGTVGEKLLDSIPSLLGAGENILAKIAESVENANFSGGGIFGKILDSITSSSANYFEYGEKILANIGNSILNADYAKLGKSLSTIFTNALNSISNLLADLDMNKVGSNIADFIKAIDWKGIAESVIDLLGSAIGSLGDIAAGFFENMDGETFMNALSVLAAPRLLGGMLTAFKGTECQTQFGSLREFMGAEIGKGGESAGVSYMTAFEYGAKAFIAGWGIGTAIRNSLVKEFGEDNVNRFFTAGGLQTLHEYKEYVNAKGEAEDTFIDKEGTERYKYDLNGEETEAYKKFKSATTNTAVDSNEIFKYYGANGLQSAYKYDDFGNFSEAWKKYGGAAFGDGGRVTRPTIALIGEKEPETVIPDSKINSIGGNIYNITLNVNGTWDMTDPIERQKLIEEFSMELRNLNIQEIRAQGGVAW